MHSLEPSKQMYVALLPAYPCTAQTNKYTYKTGISVDMFLNDTSKSVKLKYGLWGMICTIAQVLTA